MGVPINPETVSAVTGIIIAVASVWQLFKGDKDDEEDDDEDDSNRRGGGIVIEF